MSALAAQAAEWVSVEAADAFARRGRRASSPSIPRARRTTIARRRPRCRTDRHRPRAPSLDLHAATRTPPARARCARAQFARHFQPARAGRRRSSLAPNRRDAGWSSSPPRPGRRRRQTRFAPEKATAAGLLKTLALEAPALDIRHIDFDAWRSATDAQCLSTELRCRTSRPEVAYRQGRRLEAWLAPVDLAHERLAARPVEDGGRISSPAGSAASARRSPNTWCATIDARCCLIGTTPLDVDEAAIAAAAARIARRRSPTWRESWSGEDAAAKPTSSIAPSMSATRPHCARRSPKRRRVGPAAGRRLPSRRRRQPRTPRAAARSALGLAGSTATFEWMFQSKVYGTEACSRRSERGGPTPVRRLLVGQRHLRRRRPTAPTRRPTAVSGRLLQRRVAPPPIRAPTASTGRCGTASGMSEAAPAYVRDGSRDLGYRILSEGQGHTVDARGSASAAAAARRRARRARTVKSAGTCATAAGRCSD